jgi:hypothetical protein
LTRSDQKLAVQEEVHEQGRERTSETVQTGPETITTTTEEFEVPGPLSPDGSSPPHQRVYELGGIEKHASDGLTAPAHPDQRSVPAAPVLVKRTVVVDQRGASLATKNESSTQAKTASLSEKQEKASDTKKKTSYWPPLWMWLAGAVLLGRGGWLLRSRLARIVGL